MERRGTLTDTKVKLKYRKIEGDFKRFPDKNRGQSWVYRVVTSKCVLQKLQGFLQEIETLMTTLNVVGHRQKAEMHYKLEQLMAQYAKKLTEDSTIAQELKYNEQQVEALSVLRHEYNNGSVRSEQRAASSESVDSTVLRNALHKASTLSRVELEGSHASLLRRTGLSAT